MKYFATLLFAITVSCANKNSVSTFRIPAITQHLRDGSPYFSSVNSTPYKADNPGARICSPSVEYCADWIPIKYDATKFLNLFVVQLSRAKWDALGFGDYSPPDECEKQGTIYKDHETTTLYGSERGTFSGHVVMNHGGTYHYKNAPVLALYCFSSY
ncbi:MAG: hypothetical protein JNM27_21365 [Leptospirales bacterium]|nr:hypothetical protein [Leptospirales bacterium]